MFTSFAGILERVTCKISGRYVPISPTYDRNEFDQIYNKETHQKSLFSFLSKFHQILDFLKAKLPSKLKIYTNSKKKFNFAISSPQKIDPLVPKDMFRLVCLVKLVFFAREGVAF